MDKIIANTEIDIVDICLPPHLHFSTALKFLEAGKHVICEKPLSTSVNDAQKLIDISHSMNKNLYPVFQYRYGKHILILKDLISKGITGKPIVASSEVHWNRNEEYYNVPWRGSWEGEGGGAILSHAIHSHDLLSYFFGNIKSVSANISTLVNQIETEDCASIAMTTEFGALISSSITLGAANDSTRLKLVFEKISVEENNGPVHVLPKQFKLHKLPMFLEGYVHALRVCRNPKEALERALELSKQDANKPILGIGSIYLVGNLLTALGLDTIDAMTTLRPSEEGVHWT
jgi:predicted dehydrogenase